MVTAVRLRFRTEVRSRWVGWVALGVLTGIVAGAVCWGPRVPRALPGRINGF